MANIFDQSQIDKARYGYQKQTYTWGPATLAVGSTTIFTVQNWNTPNNEVKKICTLDGLYATQNINVQLQWTYDDYQSDQAQGWTDGFPSDMRKYPTRAISSRLLKLVVNNQTGSTIANFQINYEVSVQTINTFQRLLLGFQSTKADTDALSDLASAQPDINTQVQQLLSKGTFPHSFTSVYNALFLNRRVSNPPTAVPFHLVIPSGGTLSNIRTITVPTGLIYIIRGISLEGAPNITLSIDRDNDSTYVNTINAQAFVQIDDSPWEFFIPFKDHIAVSATGSTAATYPVRIDIDAYMASDLLSQHLLMSNVTSKVQIGLQ